MQNIHERYALIALLQLLLTNIENRMQKIFTLDKKTEYWIKKIEYWVTQKYWIKFEYWIKNID